RARARRDGGGASAGASRVKGAGQRGARSQHERRETMPARRKSRKTPAGKGLQPLRQTLRLLVRERSRLVARARTEAARYLTTSRQRALGSLMKQARRLRTDIERRMKRGRREFEARAEKVLTRVEHRAVRALSATMNASTWRRGPTCAGSRSGWRGS